MVNETKARRSGLRERMRGSVEAWLSDSLMVALALALVPTALCPMFLEFSPIIQGLFSFVNDVILAVFALEYALKLWTAESRKRFLLDPWRLLDLAILLLAAADILSLIEGGNASPVLRLLRLLRLAAITGRTMRRAEVLRGPWAGHAARAEMVLRILEEGRLIRPASKEEVTSCLQSPSDTWADAQNLSEGGLDFISEALKFPKYILASKVIQESFPRVDYYRDYTTVFLWDLKLDPAAEAAGRVAVTKNGFLLVWAKSNVLTICTGASGIFEEVMAEGLVLPEEPFEDRVLYSVLKRKVKDYEAITQALERKTASLEEQPAGMTEKSFLEECFGLKKEIQRALYNLWHFRQVVDSILSRRKARDGANAESADFLGVVLQEAQYLYETLENVKDSVISLIELHINTVSLDMNRVMRLLAVITALSLFPAIIGGLLGQNLIDQPYNVKIWEIFFVVGSLMTLGLYGFWSKGWLR